MIKKLHETRDNEQGFTLVELLVVIIIIGILAAIAIPAFLNQRQRANDAAVKSDVKNVATQIETALVDNPNATSIGVSTSNGVATIAINSTAITPTVSLTDDVTVETEAGSDANGYILYGQHSNGKKYTGDNWLVYNSETGGLQDNAVDRSAP